jgi:hypothetical protein
MPWCVTGEPIEMEPSVSAVSLSLRPGASAGVSGGISRPRKVREISPTLAGSTSMYAPESRVSRPLTPPMPMRGRTTQKRLPLRSSGSASCSMRALTTTFARSGASVTDSTWPTSTLL